MRQLVIAFCLLASASAYADTPRRAPAHAPRHRAHAQFTSGPFIEGRLGVVERCDDYFLNSVLSPLGDVAPALGFLPLFGKIFRDNDVPDAAWSLVQRASPTLEKFRNATGVVAESPHVGNYTGGFPSGSPLGDESVVSYEDYPDVHDSFDVNFYLKLDPDPAHAFLLSTYGVDSRGFRTGEPNHFPDTLQVEWETGILTSERTGDGRFFPKWAWPVPGDRVWVNGYWVFDCGHARENVATGEKGVRTEIHPPRAVAAMRQQTARPPGVAQPVPVTATDVYVHGRAGVIVDLLECGGRVILDNRTCPTRTGETQKGSDSADGDPSHDIALDHLGIPIDEDFQFTVCTPPPPAGATADSLVYWHERRVPDDTINIAPRIVVQDASGPCASPEHGPRQLLVTLPLQGTGVTPDHVYARRIFAGWTAPPRPLRNWRVTLDRMKMHDDLDHDSLEVGSDDCECSWFWTSVDRAPDELIRLSDAAFSSMDSFGDGETRAFVGASWEFLAPDGQPFTLRTFGFDGGVGEDANDPKQDCLDDHFGHHDFGAHVDLTLTDIPDFCISSLAFFDPQDAIDDPFDILRRPFEASELQSLVGAWPATGSAALTLRSPQRCLVTFLEPFSNTFRSRKVTCESEAQIREAFAADGVEVFLVDLYHQYEMDVRIESLPADSDGDALNDGDEAAVHGTDPLVPDTDGDGLTDGAEVNTHHTDPLVADTDGDGLTDGAEVNTHHTDPLDSDSDEDGLPDGVEVTAGTNPLDADSDDDGIPDGRDPQLVIGVVEALVESAFAAAGHRDAMLSRLAAIEGRIAAGQTDHAVRELEQLRARLDGCGAEADSDDWIVECASQMQIRTFVDLLIANLQG